MGNYGRGWSDGYGGQSPGAIDENQARDENQGAQAGYNQYLHKLKMEERRRQGLLVEIEMIQAKERING